MVTALPHEDNQKALEQRLTSLFTISKRCTTERGKFISQMAKNPNPFEGDIAHAVKELLHSSQDSLWEHSQAGEPLEPAIETANWDRLCAFCAREVENANASLLQTIEKMTNPE